MHMPLPANVREATSGEAGFRGNIGLSACLRLAFRRRTVALGPVRSSLHRRRPLREAEREDFGVVQTATLTLLALIIGFSFSMAIVRYDLRKNYEEAEANAIGTEYFRAGLLPGGDTAVVTLPAQKVSRLAYFVLPGHGYCGVPRGSMQMWRTFNRKCGVSVEAATLAQRHASKTLTVSGMNDVLNSQGYTQAAWWNRIPVAAWVLLAFIAIGCNLLVGYGAHGEGVRAGLLIDSSADCRHFVSPDRRHRLSSSRLHSRVPSESCKPLRVLLGTR